MLLQVTIDENGVPTDIVAPVTDIGFGFEEAAIEMLRKEHFSPGYEGWKNPSVSQVQIPVTFTLKDRK